MFVCRCTPAICIGDTCQWPRQLTIPVRISILPLYSRDVHMTLFAPRKPLFNHTQNVQQTKNVFLDYLSQKKSCACVRVCGVSVTMYDVVTFTLLHNSLPLSLNAHRGKFNSIKRPMKMYHRKICVPCHRNMYLCLCLLHEYIQTKNATRNKLKLKFSQ